MRLNYMWSQPLIEKSKKAITIYIYIYTIPITNHGLWGAVFRIWMVSPLACCPLALRWLPGYHHLWLVLHGLPRWRQNFQRRHLCRWRTDPRARWGWGDMAWHGRGAREAPWEKSIRRGLLFNFWSWLDVISVSQYTYVYMTTLWTSEPGLTTHAYRYPKL